MNSQSKDNKKLIVIIPARNEEASISTAIESLKKISDKLKNLNLSLSIYVVDDGSSDNTKTASLRAGADRVIRRNEKPGLGAAVRTGLVAAVSDGAHIVVKIDADLQHEPHDIPSLLKPIIEDEADIVYGNRFEKPLFKMPFIRKMGNIAFTSLMKKLTGWPIKDSQPGIFALGKAYLGVFFIPGDYNCTQQILIDAFIKGMRFSHIPVSFNRRTSGSSFISAKYPFLVLSQIIMLLVSIKPLKVFSPIGLLFLLIGGAIFFTEISLWFAGILPRPVDHVNATLGFSLFGLQTLFFGLLAELIVRLHKK